MGRLKEKMICIICKTPLPKGECQPRSLKDRLCQDCKVAIRHERGSASRN